MIHRLRLHLAAILISLLSSGLSASGEEIKPPFGLHWGETMPRLERLLQGAKAKITEKRTIGGREAWEVSGILANDLQRTMFYFVAGELVEVELQYKTDGWDDDRYSTFMGDVRRRLEAKYGAPELIARKEEPIGEVIQKVVGWKWNQNNTGIELFYFSAQNARETFKTLSVHYKTY